MSQGPNAARASPQSGEYELSPGLAAAILHMTETELVATARMRILEKLIPEKEAELKAKVPEMSSAAPHCDGDRRMHE